MMFSGSGAMNIPGGGSLNTLQISLNNRTNLFHISALNRSEFYRFIRAMQVALGGWASQSAQWNGSQGFLIILETSSTVPADAVLLESSCSNPFNS